MRRNILLTLVLLLLAHRSIAQAPQAGKKIMDDMIIALGGQAFLGVHEIRAVGRFYLFTKGELSAGDEFVDYIKFPDIQRTDVGKEKNRAITINKGAEGWTITDKGRKVEPQPAGQAQESLIDFQTGHEYVLRFVLRHPQTTIQHLGDEIVNFNRADVVELRDAAKNLIRFYVDRSSHLPIKMQVRLSGKPGVREQNFGNWHLFGGVKTPLFVTRFKDGVKLMEVRLESIDYSPGFSASVFDPDGNFAK